MEDRSGGRGKSGSRAKTEGGRRGVWSWKRVESAECGGVWRGKPRENVGR